MSQSVEGTRDLRKLIPSTDILYSTDTDATTASNGWEVISNAVKQWVVYRTYIDIVGWSKDDITAFMQGAAFQEGGPLSGTLTGAHPVLNVYDMVTTSYITDNQFTDEDNYDPLFLSWCPPGLMKSNYNLEEVIAGRCRSFVADTSMPALPRISSQSTWGAGDATAADRIYLTRAVWLGAALINGAFVVVPDAAYVVPTVLVKESDLVYMERLRRSYVLAENR